MSAARSTSCFSTDRWTTFDRKKSVRDERRCGGLAGLARAMRLEADSLFDPRSWVRIGDRPAGRFPAPSVADPRSALRDVSRPGETEILTPRRLAVRATQRWRRRS